MAFVTKFNDFSFKIRHWMVTGLGLRGRNLILYAMVYDSEYTLPKTNKIVHGLMITSRELKYLCMYFDNSVELFMDALDELKEKELLASEIFYVNGEKVLRVDVLDQRFIRCFSPNQIIAEKVNSFYKKA